MKFWFVSCALILATSCSHGSTKDASATAKADGKREAKMAPATTKTVKATVTNGEAAAGHVACKHGKDERLLEIVTKGAGCAVEYTKLGGKTEIASAAHDTGHCKQVFERVRGKLEAAHFSCN